MSERLTINARVLLFCKRRYVCLNTKTTYMILDEGFENQVTKKCIALDCNSLGMVSVKKILGGTNTGRRALARSRAAKKKRKK